MTTNAANTRGVFARPLIRVISSVMIMAGLAALAYVTYVTVSARYFQDTEAAKFSISAKTQAVSPAPKIDRRRRIVVDGDVIGMLEIDSVGLRAVVVQGDSSNVLRRAV